MKTVAGSFWKKLKELDLFYDGKDDVHKTMRRIVKRLEKSAIRYVIVGGMAVFFHGHRRATNDVDLLLTRAGFAEFCDRFAPRSYQRAEGRPRRFLDRKSSVMIDILVTGHFPGSGAPGPIAYPDPNAVGVTIDKVHFVNLLTLIELKLAARRYQDFADVVQLIRHHNLDESYSSRLHASVRDDFIECLEEKRREDEYEARE